MAPRRLNKFLCIFKPPSKYNAPIKDSTESAKIEIFILSLFFDENFKNLSNFSLVEILCKKFFALSKIIS